MTAPHQLALRFPYQPSYAPHDFLRAASNALATAWLARVSEWPEGRLALWGEAGCGKTHLLHIWALRSGAALLTGPELDARPDGPPTAGVAIDDADQAPEAPLLHLLNAAREARLSVLLSARTAPARWMVRLPDLASRLRAITAVAIEPPDDALMQALLLRLLADRQLIMPPALQAWMLLRLPRSPAVLREAVSRLDHASLSAGGRISRTIAAEILAALTVEEESSGLPSGLSQPPPSVL